ncbi:MAG: diguanylate cyclase [Candidatus Omnitrophota bacterium]|nr:MAG: diguanylate cyclase [Candidatus Omnitrophota bacterium]
MFIYLMKRLIMLIPLLIGISIISFMVIHLAPGSPADVQGQLSQKVSLQARQRLNQVYGLDKPLGVQYYHWFLRFLKFDFGNSFVDGQRVSNKIAKRIPITLTINILSLFLIFLISIPIGVLSAVYAGSFFDRIMTVLVFVGFAMPVFWIALLLMRFFGITLHWLPISGIRSLEFENYSFFCKFIDYIKHLFLPVMLSAFTGLAGISRYMRTNMLEILRADYIRTAKAKGLSLNRIYFVHALKNALLPIITILGLLLPGLIGGSVIFESIFAIPGMGKLFFDSVMARDYPVIMGLLVIGAFLTLAGNLFADMAYCVADPRIRYTDKK